MRISVPLLVWLFGFLLVNFSFTAAQADSEFKVGQTVYGVSTDGNHYVGEILKITANDAEVHWTLQNGTKFDSTWTWPTYGLYPQNRCTRNNICENQLVFNPSSTGHAGNTGIVKRVFGDNNIEVALTPTYNYSSEELSYWKDENTQTETNCYEKFCKGGSVYAQKNGSNFTGIITNAFSRGYLEVKWKFRDGYAVDEKEYLSASELALETSCIRRICKGTFVYGAKDGYQYTGIVKRLFDNGMIEILWTLKNGDYSIELLEYWKECDIFPLVKCVGNICEGTSVFGEKDGSQYTGTVSRIFEKGTVEVKWTLKNGNYSIDLMNYWNLSELFVNARCASGQICEGSMVLYSVGEDHFFGQVKKIFLKNNDTKYEVEWKTKNGYSLSMVEYVSYGVFLEVRCSRNICQGDTVYGNNGHALKGTANRLFENGQTEVHWIEYDGSSPIDSISYWSVDYLSKTKP